MLAERLTASQLADMSAQAAKLAGSLRAGDLQRLSAIAAPGVPGNPIGIAIGFDIGPDSLPLVRIQAQGVLQLVCQRCLSPMDWPLDIDVSLTAATEAQAAELADPFDSILLEDGELALRSAVEDEILSALPFSPVHADPAECGVSSNRPEETPEQEHKVRPFSGLAELMRRRDGRGQE